MNEKEFKQAQQKLEKLGKTKEKLTKELSEITVKLNDVEREYYYLKGLMSEFKQKEYDGQEE